VTSRIDVLNQRSERGMTDAVTLLLAVRGRTDGHGPI